MARGTLVAQITREAPSAPMRGTFVAPTLLPVCCVCALIRDETWSSHDRDCWVTPWTYRKTHGASPTDFPRTHTYCQKCFMRAQAAVKQQEGKRHEVADHSFDHTGPENARSPAEAHRAAGAETYALPLSPCDDLQVLIAKPTYDLCGERGNWDGSVLEEWLDAKREMVSRIPPV